MPSIKKKHLSSILVIRNNEILLSEFGYYCPIFKLKKHIE